VYPETFSKAAPFRISVYPETFLKDQREYIHRDKTSPWVFLANPQPNQVYLKEDRKKPENQGFAIRFYPKPNQSITL
jgi:hypothetical protein